MKKLLCTLLFLPLLIASCNSDSDKPKENTDETILSSFTGSYTNGLDNFSEEGVIQVEHETFTFVNILGGLTGEATLQTEDGETFYAVNIYQGEGIFENINTMSGKVDNDYISLEGTNTSGNPIDLKGELMTMEEADEQWREEHDKSLVVFNNLQSCNATITLNGETLSPLDKFYTEEGLCGPYYEFWRNLSVDVDNASSSLSCHDITLEMMDGTFETFEVCYNAFFVVDKLTEYEYTVEWDNGETTTDTFTSADGGMKKTICVNNNGDDCSSGGGSDPILITNNTIEVDYKNSNLPTDEEGLPIYIDETIFSIGSTTLQGDQFSTVTIGDDLFGNAPSGFNRMGIELYIRNGISNGTYEVEYWSEDAPLGIDVVFGGNGVYFTNADNYLSSGTITVSNYNEANKTCEIYFDKVSVAINCNSGTSCWDITFSGTIGGTFTNE